MDHFEIEIETAASSVSVEGAKIKAIGVGGGGGNMINHMISENVKGIDLIVANTDAQALESSLSPIKLQLGTNATRGLGAGMKPEIGREAALEDTETLIEKLSGAGQRPPVPHEHAVDIQYHPCNPPAQTLPREPVAESADSLHHRAPSPVALVRSEPTLSQTTLHGGNRQHLQLFRSCEQAGTLGT